MKAYKSLLMGLACGAGILCFNSCATVKEARAVQHEQSRQLPGEYTVPVAQSGLKTDQPMSLMQLEQIALNCNPSVLQASMAVDSARIALANAKAGYLPTLSASAGHTRSTQNTDRHRQSTHNTGSYSGGLNFSMMIYDFGQTNAQVEQAQSNLLAAEMTYQATRHTVVYNVRKAFFEVKRAIDLHLVAVESVTQYKEHLDQVKVKKEIGASISYDVTKAEVDYQNAKLNEITTANNIAVGWADLNLALGFAENPTYTLGDSPIHEYHENADELMAIAREHEPALVALELKTEAASYYVDETIADLYPTFSLSLSGTVSGRNPSLPWLWNLAGRLTGAENLYNAGRNMNAINDAVIYLRQARSNYAAQEQTVYRNLRAAVLTIIKAQQQLEVAQLTEKSAKENLDIINEKFKNGKATSVDRTDAQVSYSTARASVVTAHFDYLEAQTAVAALIGD